jgi:hypothetical protein
MMSRDLGPPGPDLACTPTAARWPPHCTATVASLAPPEVAVHHTTTPAVPRSARAAQEAPRQRWRPTRAASPPARSARTDFPNVRGKEGPPPPALRGLCPVAHADGGKGEGGERLGLAGKEGVARGNDVEQSVFSIRDV